MFPAFLTTILFSLSAVTGSRAAKIFGATEGNFWRLCLAATCLGLFAHSWGGGLGGGGFHVLFISGCIGFGIGDISLFHAYGRIGSRLTILLVQCLAAPFAALTEWLWLGNALSQQQMLAGATILVGVGLALAPAEHLKIDRRTLVVGILFGLVAAYCQGFGAVLSRKAYEVVAANGQHIDGITTAYQRILGGVVVSGIFLLVIKRREIWHNISGHEAVEEGRRTSGDKWKRGWYWTISNGLAGPAFGVSCYQWALLTHPTGVVLPIVALTPLAVIPLARVMEGERPTRQSLIGAVIAVAGAVAMTVVT